MEASIIIVVALVTVIGWVSIWGKAGYSKWLGLLMIVPLVNVVAFLVFAFSDWPILREKQRESSMSGGEP
ncbi:hypothetical protein M1O19_00225 [Dehalococcoidia bacterium]|nr:hypothetical protein [Dehalococcoidia bacterium]